MKNQAPATINALGARAVALELFDKLPDDALIGYPELSLLAARSEDTLRQARRLGKLPIPKHPSSGRLFRCTVRDARAWLRGELRAAA